MLLTSGQISMTISSCIVFIFTSLLFLSGYVLQQQTVRDLQAVIKPPLPPTKILPSDSPPTPSKLAKSFGNPPGSEGHSIYEEYISGSNNSPDGGWDGVAYVQLLTNELQACSAVMLFAQLARQESPAQRILLFPSAWWDEEKSNSTHHQQEPLSGQRRSREKVLRLLQLAAEGFNVQLIPVHPIVDGDDETSGYPLVGLLSLTQFRRLVYLRPSGLLLDSAPLDALFTQPMIPALATIQEESARTALIPPIVIVKPSMQAYRDMLPTLSPSSGSSEESFLRDSVSDKAKAPGPGAGEYRLVAEMSALGTTDDDFNATTFLANTAYVHIENVDTSDLENFAPEDAFFGARPNSTQSGEAWEAVSKMFRELQKDVCGLHLDPA